MAYSYHKALAAYTVIPAHWLLRHELPAAWLKDRHVLIGSSSLGLGDRVSTPLAPLSAGVTVHAASLSALLDLEAGQLAAPWSGQPWVSLWILAGTLLATLIIARFRAWIGALGLLALSLAWLMIALAGALHQAEWSISAPLWGMLVLLLFGIPHEWRLAQKKSQQAINTLGHYVSSQVLNEILRANLQYSLQPTLRDVTVLIADIEGYTRMTSALSLAQAADLTKGILECLTRPLLAAGGTLDKYSGDGLVAFWGGTAGLPRPGRCRRRHGTGDARCGRCLQPRRPCRPAAGPGAHRDRKRPGAGRRPRYQFSQHLHRRRRLHQFCLAPRIRCPRPPDAIADRAAGERQNHPFQDLLCWNYPLAWHRYLYGHFFSGQGKLVCRQYRARLISPVSIRLALILRSVLP